MVHVARNSANLGSPVADPTPYTLVARRAHNRLDMANLFMQRCRLHYYPWRQKGDLNRFEGAPVHGQYRTEAYTGIR